MAITASGMYGLTFEKYLINGAALNLEAEDNKVGMVTDTHAPDFNADDFWADVDNEVSGTGYTAGGQAVTGTEVTVASGVLTYDTDDPAWTGSTITDAMAAVYYHDAVTDELIVLQDFVNAASSSGGTFTIEQNASGLLTIDYTP